MLWKITNLLHHESGYLLVEAATPRDAVIAVLTITHDSRGICHVQDEDHEAIVTIQGDSHLLVKSV